MNEVLQEVFDKIVYGMIAQGGPSILESSCAYRGANNARCAIGQLLSDEQIQKYSIREGMTPEQFSRDLIHELLPEIKISEAIEFLNDLQDCHDCIGNTPNFTKRFKQAANDVAEKWNLKRV